MGYTLDISTEAFRRIQHHETTILTVPASLLPGDVQPGESLKLYHPADPAEALRIEVAHVDRMQINEKEDMLSMEIILLEWMFRMETELDELLREEKLWLEGLEI